MIHWWFYTEIFQSQAIDSSTTKYYKNIASTELNSMCSVNSQFSSSFACVKSLDNINSLFDSNEEWAANCIGENCIGISIQVNFKEPVIPRLLCLTIR